MKVLHICLSNFFIDDHSYQENELVYAHAQAGHEVLVLASVHDHGADGNYAFSNPGKYQTQEGVPVVRLPYHPLLPNWLGIRLRIHRGVYGLIEEFGPDVILFHGLSGWELLTTARYAKNNPRVVLYADNHSDYLTAGRTFFTRWALHYAYYRSIALLALPYIKKILCISPLTMEYAENFYGIPKDKLELFPLGGRPLNRCAILSRREACRKKFEIGDEDIVFIQSGKQYARKYLPEALVEFSKINDSRFRFLIVGLLMDDIKATVESLVAADSRVEFIGWKDSDSLRDLLCAADVYLQPGRQSATMQESLCCGCAVILERLPSNTLYVNDNGWIIDKPTDLAGIFQKISSGDADLNRMSEVSLHYAHTKLDYKILASRVLK